MSTTEFHTYIMNDVFADIDGITSRRMFSGYGIYRYGNIFAFIIDDTLYFKVGENNRSEYVLPSGKHYPLHFRRFRKREECQERKTRFLSHTELCIELIDWVVEQDIPGDITFDSYFTGII